MAATKSSHAQRVLSSLNQQRAVGRFCDATLNLGDGVLYWAHRNILACFSELAELSSTDSTASAEFCLQSCPGDGLDLVLSFIYTGELRLEEDNLQRVQQAAASLQVPEALSLCQQFQRASLQPAPVKKKPGRPRKSPSAGVKEEDLLSAPAGEAAAATAAPGTTTRSGRVVKGPRWLETAADSSSSDWRRTALGPEERGTRDEAEKHLAAESQVEHTPVPEHSPVTHCRR